MEKKTNIGKVIFYIIIVLMPIYFIFIAPSFSKPLIAAFESMETSIAVLVYISLIRYGTYGIFLFAFVTLYSKYAENKISKILFTVMTLLMGALVVCFVVDLSIPMSNFQVFSSQEFKPDFLMMTFMLYLLISISSIIKKKDKNIDTQDS